MRLSLLAILWLCSNLIYAASNSEVLQIEQRIQPVGKVHVQDETVKTQKQSTEKQKVGKKIYERFCVVCHRDGLVGAPKFHDEQAWESRLAGKKLEELVASAIKGLNAMPAKGTCYECNEEDIKSAVEYMLPNHD
ncbi:cytochrome c5 family protein [Legionella sp. km772]|uniref:c-type cytochrome n=1 Tax=Legionella sp. km772 TaxID=2498111 RepID=UPI000F8D796A|nr:c-type cytochrome [Legionella sp. km772]RUR12020.1 cytochrome c5 family protein [Legionella sp. km772]